jgi:hypothetical protein
MSRHYYTYAQQPYYGGQSLGDTTDPSAANMAMDTSSTTTTSDDSGTDWVKVGMQAAEKLYELWESSQDEKAAAAAANRERQAAERERQAAERAEREAADRRSREERRREQQTADAQALELYDKAIAAAKANKVIVGIGLLGVSAGVVYYAMRKMR